MFKLYIPATVHVDRFLDLNLLVEGLGVTIEPHSVGDDQTINVLIFGDDDVILKLDDSVHNIRHILASPMVFEGSE